MAQTLGRSTRTAATQLHAATERVAISTDPFAAERVRININRPVLAKNVGLGKHGPTGPPPWRKECAQSIQRPHSGDRSALPPRNSMLRPNFWTKETDPSAADRVGINIRRPYAAERVGLGHYKPTTLTQRVCPVSTAKTRGGSTRITATQLPVAGRAWNKYPPTHMRPSALE